MFGRKKEFSAQERSGILKKVLEKVQDGVVGSDLRMLIAESIGNGTSADSTPVTSIVADIKSYGLPRTEKSDVVVPQWWDGATHAARISALNSTVDCLK